MIVPLYKCKGERTDISLLSMIGKMYVGILVGRMWRVREGFIDDDQGGFRSGRGCVDQIFTVKQIGEKAQEKKQRMYEDLRE